MDQAVKIAIVEPSASARRALGLVFAAYPEVADVCVLFESADAFSADGFSGMVVCGAEASLGCDFAGGEVSYVRDVRRAGEVIDRALAMRRRILRQRQGQGAVRFGPYSLDIEGRCLLRLDALPVRLTEKEVDLLLALYGQGEAPLGREALLAKVWAYAEGVQTHTLETHIYRLRQKIEADPARPAVLLTRDPGYALAPAGGE